MGKTNYNKISEEVKEEKAAVVEPEVTADVVEEPAEVKEVKTTKAPKKPKVVKGIVANCASLRVRREPAVGDNTFSIIDAGTEVAVNMDKSTEDWYKITVMSSGLTGFCMKDYITVK